MRGACGDGALQNWRTGHPAPGARRSVPPAVETTAGTSHEEASHGHRRPVPLLRPTAKSQWPVWWVKLHAAGRAVGPPVSQTSRVAPSRHPRSFATWCGRSPVSSSGLDSRGPGPGTGEDVTAPQPTACQTPAAGPPSRPEADRKCTRGPIKAGRTSQLSPAPGASPRNPELSVGAQTETPGYGELTCGFANGRGPERHPLFLCLFRPFPPGLR